MAPKKLMGGSAQQLAQLEEEEGPEPPSHLGEKLLALWAWGQMSAPTVQQLASAAYKDGLRHPQIEKMALVGGEGKFPGNMQRDLMVIVGESAALQQAETSIPIRVQRPEGGGLSEETKLSFLLPHKVFAFLFHTVHAAFVASILGGAASNIVSFWRAMRSHPFTTARPELQARADLAHVIPLALHGDGVAYMQAQRAGGKSLDVLSWSSLLSKGPTKTSTFLMFVLVKTLAKDFGVSQTWPRVWHILCWSLQVLASGVWPLLDWDNNPFPAGSIDDEKKGTPLAGGYCGVVFLLRSDLEFLSNHFGLESPASNTPCALCRADRSMDGAPWTDCRPGAAWKHTCWGKEDWARARPNCHALFRMPGAGIDMVFPDLMHCKHLGTDSLVLGSVLTWLVKHYLKGSVKENLSIVWSFIRQWYKEWDHVDVKKEDLTIKPQKCV